MNLKKLLLLLLPISSCSYIQQTSNKAPKQQETPIVLTFEERLDLSEQIFNLAKSLGYKVVTSATNDGILIKAYSDFAQIKNKTIALLDIYNLISSNLNKPIRLFKTYKAYHFADEQIHSKPYIYYFYWGTLPTLPYIPNNGTLNNLEDIRPTITLRHNSAKAPHYSIFGLLGDNQHDLAMLLFPLAGAKFSHLGIISISDPEISDYYWNSLYSENDLREDTKSKKILESIRLQIQNILLRNVSIEHIKNPNTPNILRYNKKNKKIKHGYKFKISNEPIPF